MKAHSYLQRSPTKDIYRLKLEQIKAIANLYPGVNYNFTFCEDSHFQNGVLIVNPEDDIKDIERAFKGRCKSSE